MKDRKDIKANIGATIGMILFAGLLIFSIFFRGLLSDLTNYLIGPSGNHWYDLIIDFFFR